MAIINLKMALGIVILFSSWIKYIGGKPAAQQQQSKSLSQTGDDNANLKKFIDLIKNRISLGKDVAEYKWIEGEAVLDEAREKKVLESAKKTTQEMGFEFKPEDQLFLVDLMEATKFLEYVLISNWNGATKEGSTPKEAVDITVTREKISGMQKDLIELLYALKTLQNGNDCQASLAKAIGDTRNQDILITLALQRAFGNYCKVNINHKSK